MAYIVMALYSYGLYSYGLYSYGCPSTCKHKAAYTNRLAEVPCEDARPGGARLAKHANEWVRVVNDGWRAFYAAYGTSWAQLVNASGCDAYIQTLGAYFPHIAVDPPFLRLWACGSTEAGQEFGPFYTPVKTLHIVCPVACGCTGVRPDPACPSRCLSRANATQIG